MNGFGTFCLVWVAALAPAFAAQLLDYSGAGPTGPQIDAYLNRKGSPMMGMGGAFANYGRTYNVDPRLVVAISGAETTFGKHLCAPHNAWNWFHHGNCPASPFSSYPAGAEEVTRFLRLSYLNKGYDTVPLIRAKYCAAGCENWVPLVMAFLDEMPAGPLAAPLPSPPAAPVPEPVPAPAPAGTTTGPPAVPAPEIVPGTAPPAGAPSAPAKPAAPTAEPEHGMRVFGVPLYVVLILGALAMGAWATGGLRRS